MSTDGEVAPEPPAPGETTTSSQPPLAPIKRHSAFESPIEQQQTRKLPQRKRSVFSFNGFPDMQLLDQQVIKTRLAPTDQNVANQTPSQQTMAKGSAIETTSDATVKTSARAQPIPLPPQHQPRSDTLGSTGSSRASSCDEPPIVTGSTISSQQANRLATNCSRQSEATKQHDEQQPRKISSTTLNGTSSSSSSIESMGAGWPSTTTLATSDKLGQQNTNETTADLSDNKNQEDMKQHAKTEQIGNSSNSDKDATTNEETDNPLAFKSIKGQLKRNSIPNAQLIQQHIDNLIRHNESIVENWNLVSIRSYNSSRDLQPPSVTTSSSSSTNPNMATTVTTAGASNKRASLPSEELQGTTSAQMASNSSKLSLPKTNSSKRWSTSLLPSGYNLPSASVSVCDTKKLAGGLERKRSSHQLGGGFKLSSSSLLSDPLLFQKSTLNRASLDSSTCMSVPSSPRQSKSPSATYDLTSMHLHHNNAISSHPQQQDPVQLECAIQNLSIKRKDSEHQHPMLLLQQQHQTRNVENHITSQAFFPAPDPNLIQLNHQDQERQNIVAAAMILERHRRSLVEQQMSFESQAALMRQQQQQQQQMIESQVEQLRLALALERHQQQLAACGTKSNPKQQVLTADNSNNNDAIKDLEQLHHHHLHFGTCGLPTTGQHPTLIENLVARLIEQDSLLKRQEQQQHQHQQQQHHLDNGKPAFRCDTCDVSFWTNDLLNYHRMTQCAAARVGDNGDNHHQPPLAFTFSGPNNFDNQELARQQYHQSIQMSKSVSPPRRTSVIESGALAPLASPMNGQQHQQVMIAAGQVQSSSPLAPKLVGNLEDLSILKRQLLTVKHDATTGAAATMVATSTVPLGSLPFKKRKISEPNMRY